jgi:hypothetical protein
MNLSQPIEQAVERTVAAGVGPWTIDETVDGLRFCGEVTAWESLACAWARFELTNPAWSAASMVGVKQVA